MRNALLFLCFLLINFTFAQKTSTAAEIEQGLALKKEMQEVSLVKNIQFQNIGPTVMSGRVVDVEVNPDNPIEFYVAYATGGLWYTANNGASFVPVMDQTATQNIGDIAVHWKTGAIWVGTGENNSSRSSYAGIGILKSTDMGENWQNMGLKDSHHIGRILINPTNPEEVVIGVTGHLYTPNENRGIYKTIDGGKSWRKTLFVSENSGIIDLDAAPNNFDILYAAAWEKDRKAWNFTGNGSGSAIFKSTDGGDSWTKITTEGSGFPTGDGVGRIGLAVYDENIVYAVLDNQYRREEKKASEKDGEELEKNDFKSMSTADFLKLENDRLNNFLKNNGFQEKYRAENVKQMVRSGAVTPVDLAKYLEDANALLFDTPVIGAEVYRSTDGGKQWTKQHQGYLDDLFYSYGYYFAQIRVDPNNADKIYLAGVPLIKSDDGGANFTSISKENVHADHHALWINPAQPGHLINGNDGGLNISYDHGEHWTKNNSTTVGQFYAINIDYQKPYNVYGGLQDNGVWMGPHNAKTDNSWLQTGHNPWTSILGGDGMQVQIDRRNPNIVYTGFQFGNYYRLDLKTKKRTPIQPKHELGENPFRFNWQTPIMLSGHNQDILYLGGNKLHRSLDQGETWETISDDLTQGGKKGNVAFGTITTISESPFKFGLLYTGSDDGLVFSSKDGGGNWRNVSESLPANLWVSRVAASKHSISRVYVSLNGYRSDDFTPYLYRSDDYGFNWTDISKGLPLSPVNVILEDPSNPDLLFVGTDNGLYLSLDRGASWHLFQSGIPNVAVHDLVIQPEEKHLIVGTHGRSIYKADISNIQKLTDEVLDQDLLVFDLESIKHSKRWGNSYSSWGKTQTPGLDIVFYSGETTAVTAQINTVDDIMVSEVTLVADKGLNIISYDLAFSKAGKSQFLKKVKKEIKEAKDGKTYLPKGKYKVVLSGNSTEQSVPFEIE